jgi:hypothetical protein
LIKYEKITDELRQYLIKNTLEKELTTLVNQEFDNGKASIALKTSTVTNKYRKMPEVNLVI